MKFGPGARKPSAPYVSDEITMIKEFARDGTRHNFEVVRRTKGLKKIPRFALVLTVALRTENSIRAQAANIRAVSETDSVKILNRLTELLASTIPGFEETEGKWTSDDSNTPVLSVMWYPDNQTSQRKVQTIFDGGGLRPIDGPPLFEAWLFQPTIINWNIETGEAEVFRWNNAREDMPAELLPETDPLAFKTDIIDTLHVYEWILQNNA